MKKIYTAIYSLLLLSFIGLSSNAVAQLNINASVTKNVDCFDGGDGEVTLNITAGTPPFSVEFFLLQVCREQAIQI
jgi:hypothetical protein